MSLGQLQQYVHGPDGGEALWLLGGLYTFKATGEDNLNAYTLVEVKGPQGLAIPMHFHEGESEGFYVAQGQATIFFGEEQVGVKAGSFAFAPQGSPHSFRLDDADTRLVLLITPGGAGHEEMFREMGEAAGAPVLPPPMTAPPDAERLSAVAARHGTRIVGPPPS